MKSFLVTILLLSLGLAMGCQSNTQPAPRWYKGNLHTHSYWSDGDEFPEVVMDWYKSNGYDFVALSDHNTLAEGEQWITIEEDTLYLKAFDGYLEKYGTDWVNYSEESGRIQVKLKTFEEYSSRFMEPGKFLAIPSEEITERFENKPLHMNATNVQEWIEPQGGHSVVDVLQRNINAVMEQRRKTGQPMITHVNHPNFGYGIGLEDMLALTGERFFEVYNGHPLVHNSGDSTHRSTLEMWDLINISYIENNKPLMYGLATDDSHHYHVQGRKWSNAGRGWIMVQADSLTPSSIIQAMEAGRFYATTGVVLNKLELNNNTLSLEVANQKDVNYTISFIGYRNGETEILKKVEGSSATFKLTEDTMFVRCQITSSKLQNNPIENILYEMAWTQPVRFAH